MGEPGVPPRKASEAQPKTKGPAEPALRSQMRFGVLNPTIRMSGGGGYLRYRPAREVSYPPIEGSEKVRP